MSNQTATGPVEATDANFQQVVLETSYQTPMLVDFWAPWCGPCKVIGPLLEKLEVESQGAFNLVKVNMDENPMLAQALMIRSIPTVKLVMNGEVRDEFVGALPEPQIREFLEKNLPSTSQGDAVIGLHLWREGRKEEATRIFSQVLEQEPSDPVALVGLGLQLIDQGDVDGAAAIVKQVSEFDMDKVVERSTAESALADLRARVFLVEHAGNGDAGKATEKAGELELRLAGACRLALEENYEQALEEFLAIVKKDRKFKNDAGRRGMLAVFDVLPKDSPLIPAYRTQLSSVLFA